MVVYKIQETAAQPSDFDKHKEHAAQRVVAGKHGNEKPSK
jgi:hypothetical protein